MGKRITTRPATDPGEPASAGHKLGKLVGDWFEEFFILPVLQEIATRLNLQLAHRFVATADPALTTEWVDSDNNRVDYDFVFQIRDGISEQALPVAFIESFWRRGSRHSKDKARDDSGKLLPMKATYPTARFLGIVAAGEFTQPAINLIHSRDIHLFYVPKNKVIGSFTEHELLIDYPDSADEEEKKRVLERFEAAFTEARKPAIALTLRQQIGANAVAAFADSLASKLAAIPVEFRIVSKHVYAPLVFTSIGEVTTFLINPHFVTTGDFRWNFEYQVLYSDGSEFEKTVDSPEDLRLIHAQLESLTRHMDGISRMTNRSANNKR